MGLNSKGPSIIQNKWPSPPLSLNDPHALGEDIIYTIMQALPQQMGATMCVVVLALPHPTTQLQSVHDCACFSVLKSVNPTSLATCYGHGENRTLWNIPTPCVECYRARVPTVTCQMELKHLGCSVTISI